MDNCSIHRSRAVTHFLHQNKIQTVFNVPYSPQYNGIEIYWAHAKKTFKKLNLKIKTGTMQPRPLRQVVESALRSVPANLIKKCCHHAIARIMADGPH